MRKLLLAGFLALSSCSAAPAFAQEQPQQCVSVEGVLEQIEAVKQYGARILTFARDDVPKVLDLLGAPESVKADAIVMVVGDRAAALLFIEGDQICRTLTIPLKAAMLLDHAVRGRSV